mmetsp:Transcript_76392/g.151416  ORF Transcript_76392/g.151416 Transcript_76392/m.151416 type:complete len:459 (-) Transcript_76392:210-1586(-)
MSFFASPDPTPIQSAVEHATDELLINADWSANLEIVEMISSAEVVDEILLALRQRLLPASPYPLLVSPPTAVPHVQCLALTLLQTCMANGGDIVSERVARKAFLGDTLLKLLTKDTDTRVTAQLMGLLDEWGSTFRGHRGPQMAFPALKHALAAKGAAAAAAAVRTSADERLGRNDDGFFSLPFLHMQQPTATPPDSPEAAPISPVFDEPLLFCVPPALLVPSGPSASGEGSSSIGGGTPGDNGSPGGPTAASSDAGLTDEETALRWQEERQLQAAIQASLGTQREGDGQGRSQHHLSDEGRVERIDGYSMLDTEDADDAEEAEADGRMNGQQTSGVNRGGGGGSGRHALSTEANISAVAASGTEALGVVTWDTVAIEAAEARVSLFFECLEGADSLESAAEDEVLSELVPWVREASNGVVAALEQTGEQATAEHEEATLMRLLELHERLTHALQRYG